MTDRAGNPDLCLYPYQIGIIAGLEQGANLPNILYRVQEAPTSNEKAAKTPTLPFFAPQGPTHGFSQYFQEIDNNRPAREWGFGSQKSELVRRSLFRLSGIVASLHPNPRRHLSMHASMAHNLLHYTRTSPHDDGQTPSAAQRIWPPRGRLGGEYCPFRDLFQAAPQHLVSQ